MKTINTGGPREQRRPKLLVSVRSLEEAQIAMAAGVDIVDLKEPTRGSLGAVDSEVAKKVADYWSHWESGISSCNRPELSMALGEIGEVFERQFPSIPTNMHYVKMGLAGLGRDPGWRLTWRNALRQTGGSSDHVAVAYADHLLARSPAPHAILESAAEFGCRVFLLDTCGKTGGGLFESLSVEDVGSLIEIARNKGMLVALAGSLSGRALDLAILLAPDFIAVRGAACDGGREGTLSQTRIGEIQQRMSGTNIPDRFSEAITVRDI